MKKFYAGKFSDRQYDLLQRPVIHDDLADIKRQLRGDKGIVIGQSTGDHRPRKIIKRKSA